MPCKVVMKRLFPLCWRHLVDTTTVYLLCVFLVASCIEYIFLEIYKYSFKNGYC